MLIRRLILIGALIGAAPAAAQPGKPAFEVASVRQNTSASSASRTSPVPGRFTIVNVPLRFIILDAYGLRDQQLIDAPEWTNTIAYDISATYPGGTTPTESETRLMLQQLLEDRFKLSLRTETRELPVYRLVLARTDGQLGSRLVRSNVDCDAWLAEKRPQIGMAGSSPVPGGRRPACMITGSRQGFITGGTRTLAELAVPLQAFAGRPVIDETGLTGTFDIDLIWTPDERLAPAATQPDVGISLFAALEEQLGLKLEPARRPFQVRVVQRVERPRPD
jgi:uncharacterized protein (TIGR03435 family)